MKSFPARRYRSRRLEKRVMFTWKGFNLINSFRTSTGQPLKDEQVPSRFAAHQRRRYESIDSLGSASGLIYGCGACCVLRHVYLTRVLRARRFLGKVTQTTKLPRNFGNKQFSATPGNPQPNKPMPKFKFTSLTNLATHIQFKLKNDKKNC